LSNCWTSTLSRNSSPVRTSTAIATSRDLAASWIGVGRFFEFFLRSDPADLALGLETTQWTSLALLAVAAVGAWLTLGHRLPQRARPVAPAGTGRDRRRT
jgi:prolipoprotein diacylglyceryltransferase